MADNITQAQSDRAATFHKICMAIGWPRTLGGLKRQAKWISAGAPTVDAGSQATYPLSVGDLIYDTTNSAAYICTVAPAAATASTSVLIST